MVFTWPEQVYYIGNRHIFWLQRHFFGLTVFWQTTKVFTNRLHQKIYMNSWTWWNNIIITMWNYQLQLQCQYLWCFSRLRPIIISVLCHTEMYLFADNMSILFWQKYEKNLDFMGKDMVWLQQTFFEFKLKSLGTYKSKVPNTSDKSKNESKIKDLGS